ncbi:hypothetical protein E2P63_08910 [Candidatus Bathyarchaeota archaeon]|nr:hypothetical protein E2P63_08910 [Candidatus Bathyarchaeota archaeon]
MNRTHFTQILNDIPNFSRFLKVDEVEALATNFKQHPSVIEKIIGKTTENKPLKMFTVGSGDKTALIIGVPHSDEPLGSLVTSYFVDWILKHPEVDFFDWRWLIIPVLEQRGMRMNEGWFDSWGSLVDTAKSYFREPTENQYEWTFPFEYKKYKWVHSRPESDAVKEVIINEKPDLLCNLHHCGFYDTYFYFSRDLPEAYPRLRELSGSLNLPLSTANPDVPFGKVLTAGFYQMYGLRDYINYYTKCEPENLLTIRRGSSSDEWYQDIIGGFSFNCEVPLLESLVKKDNESSGHQLRELLENRRAKRTTAIDYCIDVLTKLEPAFCFSDPVLLGSVLKHVASAKVELELAGARINASGNRFATNFEVFENDLMVDIADLLLYGQVWHVAKTILINKSTAKAENIASIINRKILALAKEINRRGKFTQIPLQKLVKMQLGSILIIADILVNSQ